jgi:hypothetical protein
MFTLKLFRRKNGQLVTRIVAVHHVQVMEIGTNKKMLEIWAFHSAAGDGRLRGDYDCYYVGEKEPDMDAANDDVLFGWGLLENWEGNTTQHFRPASYASPQRSCGRLAVGRPA